MGAQVNPGKTTKFTATTAPVAIQASVYTRAIVVGEWIDPADPNAVPTTPFSVRKPSAADDPRGIAIGGTYTFQKGSGDPFFVPYYRPGEIVGYVDLPAGSKTFIKDEVGA